MWKTSWDICGKPPSETSPIGPPSHPGRFPGGAQRRALPPLAMILTFLLILTLSGVTGLGGGHNPDGAGFPGRALT